MAAELELRADGTAKMVHFGATPWHRNSTPITEEEGYDSELVGQRAGISGKVEKVPVVTFDTHQETGAFVIRRVEDGKILGKPVGATFQPLQWTEAMKPFEPFLKSREARIETAGSLRGGSRVWALAKINRDPMVIAKGDEVNKYILLSHGHDGSLAIRFGFTPIRVVCANTLALAHRDNASKLIRIRHTEQAVVTLEKVHETMNLANAEFEATAEQYRFLASRHINTADLMKYVKTVLKIDPKEELSSRMKNIVEKVIGMCESGIGNDISSVRGTWWTAYNGVNEYLSYSYGNSVDTRLDSLWFGQNAALNKTALETALEMAA